MGSKIDVSFFSRIMPLAFDVYFAATKRLLFSKNLQMKTNHNWIN